VGESASSNNLVEKTNREVDLTSNSSREGNLELQETNAAQFSESSGHLTQDTTQVTPMMTTQEVLASRSRIAPALDQEQTRVMDFQGTMETLLELDDGVERCIYRPLVSVY
jgi:hypothetical protein